MSARISARAPQVIEAPRSDALEESTSSQKPRSQLGASLPIEAPEWTPKKRALYIILAVIRTALYALAVDVILLCREDAQWNHLISECDLHSSLRNPYLAVGWLTATNIGNLMWFAGSMYNVLCIPGNQIKQTSFSNNVACLGGAMVFASMGLSMGSVGVWWGLLIVINFFFGPMNIVLLNGRKVVTNKLIWNLLFRFLHTWDVVTDFATTAIIGASSAMGVVYLLLSLLNLAFYITSLYTNLSEESLLRICLNCTKAFGLDIPMCVIDVVLLFEVEGDGKRAVIVISALSSLLEVAGSIKAGIAFHAVSRQHAHIKKSSKIAQNIAGSLARFDLEGAEKFVDDDDLDPQLAGAFRLLLDHLKMYRPYLPDAMFYESRSRAIESLATQESALKLGEGQKRARPSTPSPPANGGIEPPATRPPQLSANPPQTQTQESQQHSSVVAHAPQPHSPAHAAVDCNPLMGLDGPPAIVLSGPPLLPASLVRQNIAALVIRMSTKPKPPVEMTRQAILESSSAFLSAVFLEAKLYRGVLHSFDTGFEVTVTFGTAGSVNSGTEVADAYKCAVALRKVFQGDRYGVVHLGLASGVAVVGNLGTANRLAFSIVGDVLPGARQACTAAALYDHPVVATGDFRFSFTYLAAHPLEEGPWQSSKLQLFSLPVTSRQYCMSSVGDAMDSDAEVSCSEDISVRVPSDGEPDSEVG